MINDKLTNILNGINLAVEHYGEQAKQAGWHQHEGLTESNLLNYKATKLNLISAEVFEAFECLRKDKMDDHLPDYKGLDVELADVFIRLVDFAYWNNINLGKMVIEKGIYNKDRADHKPENRAKADGKKF